jgi:hypothetical protein
VESVELEHEPARCGDVTRRPHLAVRLAYPRHPLGGLADVARVDTQEAGLRNATEGGKKAARYLAAFHPKTWDQLMAVQ